MDWEARKVCRLGARASVVAPSFERPSPLWPEGASLGAEVQRNPVKEIGWYDVTPTAEGEKDPLFSCFNGTEKIFQWHGDTFDIPHGAVHLATSPECPNQAFRYGERTYGLQFHLEVDEPLIHRWLKTPVHMRELEELHDERFRPEYIEAWWNTVNWDAVSAHLTLVKVGSGVAQLTEWAEAQMNKLTEFLGKLTVLTGVKEYPMRVKCATLAWHTMKAALEDDTSTVTTE